MQHTYIAQFQAGRLPTKQKRKDLELNARIRTLVADYPNRNIIDYLRAISHNLTVF